MQGAAKAVAGMPPLWRVHARAGASGTGLCNCRVWLGYRLAGGCRRWAGFTLAIASLACALVGCAKVCCEAMLCSGCALGWFGRVS